MTRHCLLRYPQKGCNGHGGEGSLCSQIFAVPWSRHVLMHLVSGKRSCRAKNISSRLRLRTLIANIPAMVFL